MRAPRRLDSERQRGFIEALADYGSVRAAANSVGLTPEGAYRLRRQPGAEEFAAAWEAALDHGVRRIEDVAMDRALNGVEVPVYCFGKVIGTRVVHNDRLLMFMLRNRLPERFCAEGPRALSAVDRHRIKRLKEAWRQEWKQEQLADVPDFDQVRASILGKLAAFDAAERRRWTPREHELHAELEAERAARKEREEDERRAHFRRINPNWRKWEGLEDEDGLEEEEDGLGEEEEASEGGPAEG